MKIINKVPQRLFSALLLCGAFLLSDCKKDELDDSLAISDYKKSSLDIPAGAFYLENALPAGYVKNGSVDYTSYIQSALTKYSTIVFPGFPLLVNDKGLLIGSNKTVFFQPGSEVRLKPSTLGIYNIVRINNSSNVRLVNPVIVGDRANHLGTGGEWGAGLTITSSKNVTVENPKISDCWGDGIFISQPNETMIIPQNITITGAKLYRNRRNGIGVICVDGLTLTDTYVYGVLESEGGTRPMAGIDFEPNYAYQELKNINVSNFKTEHQGAEGVQLRLQNLVGPGVSGKQIGINIEKHEDIGSPLAAFLMESKNPDGYPEFGGTVNISEPVWRQNPKYVFFGLGWNSPEVKVNISHLTAYDLNNQLLDSAATSTLIKRYMRSNVDYTLSVGAKDPFFNYVTGVYDITGALPEGFTKDGSVDYTTFLQGAINKYSKISFPAFPIMVNENGLKIPSNRTISFETGSELRLKPTAEAFYNILSLNKVNNVTLLHPVIVGDRTNHLNTIEGDGVGINITSSKNIVINDAEVSECWGDGLLIDQLYAADAIPEGIKISNTTFKNNRRSGINVTSTVGFELTNTYIYGAANSTRPGVDIQPTSSFQEMKNVVISNIKTENISNSGVVLRLKNLYDAANSTKTVGISIDRHEDLASITAGLLIETKNAYGYPAVGGSIKISNAVWKKSKYPFYGLGWNEPAIKVDILNPAIYDINSILLDPLATTSKIKAYMRTNATYTIGY